VDLHKRYLEWGKRNLAANAVDLAVQRFFLSDTLEFYQRARRQNRCYDLIILDPPTFSRTRRPARTFVLQEQLDALLAGAVQLLDPGGLLFLSTNDRGISRSRLEQAVQQAAGRRTCTILERPALPLDFAGDPDYAKAVLVKYG
jgi:23S rRNA (cytosine1962-C5)-methyltransferase